MARPQTKLELVEMIEFERGKLLKAFDSLTDQQMETCGACELWSVKDILSHLTDWEQRCLGWYRAGLKGEIPKTPDDNFNWRELPALNHEIYLKYKDKNLADVRRDFKESFEEMMSAINGMSEEELFTPKVYAWTGNGLLRDFLYANTASHYRWATKLIRRFVKQVVLNQ